MNKIQLDVISLHHSPGQGSNFALVLGEVDGHRRLPIVIGGFEAQAIVVAMEQMHTPRPLTHDLMVNLLRTMHVKLVEVAIAHLVEGVFHSVLVCQHGDDIIEIDSRTSDAVALAVRFRCPIYVNALIMDEAGIVYEADQDQQPDTGAAEGVPLDITDMNLEQLNDLLNEALQNEDYEKAAEIRDEIQSRQS